MSQEQAKSVCMEETERNGKPMTTENLDLVKIALQVIFYLCFIPIVMVTAALAAYIFNDVGWWVPYRWICIVGLTATAIHYILYKSFP